jgi:pyridoxamine 5'-phosphate oxidase
MSDAKLTDHDFTQEEEPFRLFAQWLDDASASEINDPNAVAVATVDEEGLPDVRMVLLKGFDERGFTFYTNFESAKGRGHVLPLEIAAPAGAGARTCGNRVGCGGG